MYNIQVLYMKLLTIDGDKWGGGTQLSPYVYKKQKLPYLHNNFLKYPFQIFNSFSQTIFLKKNITPHIYIKPLILATSPSGRHAVADVFPTTIFHTGN